MEKASLKDRIAPIGRALLIAIGLSLVQIGLLYTLNAANFFERFASIYNLYSYPFNVLGTITVFLAGVTLSEAGATQILHPETVFLRVFTVLFTSYLVYFPLSRHVGFRKDGKFKLFMKDGDLRENWKWAEALLENLGHVVALTFIQITVIYFLHTMQLLSAFQSIYNSMFFLFNYAFAGVKSMAAVIFGQNEHILYLNTDIFKRIFFLISAVNLVYFTITGLMGAKNEDDR
jgi:hypothetical protein